MVRDPSSDLPDIIDLTEDEIEEYWDLWLWWNATEGKHLPCAGALEDQPQRIMTVLFTLDSLLTKVIKQKQDTSKDK